VGTSVVQPLLMPLEIANQLRDLVSGLGIGRLHLGFPPLPRPPGPLRPRVLAPWPPALGGLGAGGDSGSSNGQHQNRPPRLACRNGCDLGGDVFPAGRDIQHRQPLGHLLGHLVGGLGTQGQPSEFLKQLTRRLLEEFLGQLAGRLLHVGLLAALRQLQRLVQRCRSTVTGLAVNVRTPEPDRPTSVSTVRSWGPRADNVRPHWGQPPGRCSRSVRCTCATRLSVTSWGPSWRRAKTACVSSSTGGVRACMRSSNRFSQWSKRSCRRGRISARRCVSRTSSNDRMAAPLIVRSAHVKSGPTRVSSHSEHVRPVLEAEKTGNAPLSTERRSSR
jgi:hypothetical protein